jgi:hypothetical protein
VSKLALGRSTSRSCGSRRPARSTGCRTCWGRWDAARAARGRRGAGDQPTRLLRFIFSKLDTALIELTPNNMRIWVDDALVTRSAVSTAISDPNFAGGGTWSTANTTSGATVDHRSGVCTLACRRSAGWRRSSSRSRSRRRPRD